jgi:hypothetical protein
MRNKKRYLILSRFPRSIPEGAEFLFQDEQGYVFRASLKATEILRSEAIFISGSMKKLKGRPKMLNQRSKHLKVG